MAEKIEWTVFMKIPLFMWDQHPAMIHPSEREFLTGLDTGSESIAQEQNILMKQWMCALNRLHLLVIISSMLELSLESLEIKTL